MPIAAWDCPICYGANLPLNHFETHHCGDKIHPDYPAAIIRHEQGHHRFGRRVVGVTDALGCPRRAAMSADVRYSVDPTALNSPSTGSAWDSWVTGSSAKLSLEGEFDGVVVVGEPDRIRGDYVEDWKHSNDFMKKYRVEAKEDHRAQVSMYAEMMRQRGIGDPKKGRIWYHFTSDFGWPVEVELMTMAEILDYKPVEGPTTVRQNLHMIDEWIKGQRTWESLPLTGKLQSYGTKTACDYCLLQKPCWKQAGGAAF